MIRALKLDLTTEAEKSVRSSRLRKGLTPCLAMQKPAGTQGWPWKVQAALCLWCAKSVLHGSLEKNWELFGAESFSRLLEWTLRPECSRHTHSQDPTWNPVNPFTTTWKMCISPLETLFSFCHRTSAMPRLLHLYLRMSLNSSAKILPGHMLPLCASVPAPIKWEDWAYWILKSFPVLRVKSQWTILDSKPPKINFLVLDNLGRGC